MLKKRNSAACIQQSGSMFTLFFGRKEVNNMDEARSLDKEEFARFFRYMFDSGVYIPPLQVEAWFVSSAHTRGKPGTHPDLILNYFKNRIGKNYSPLDAIPCFC